MKVNLSLKDNLRQLAAVYMSMGILAIAVIIIFLGIKFIPDTSPWITLTVAFAAISLGGFLSTIFLRKSDAPIRWMWMAVPKGTEVKIRSVQPATNWVPTRRWHVVVQIGDDPENVTLIDTTADCRHLKRNWHFIWDGQKFVDRKCFTPTVDQVNP